jgi:chromosome segregation ATPase
MNITAAVVTLVLLGLAFYVGLRFGNKRQLKQARTNLVAIRRQTSRLEALLKSLSPLRVEANIIAKLQERYEYLTERLNTLDTKISQLSNEIGALRFMRENSRLTATRLASFDYDVNHAATEKIRLCTEREAVRLEWVELSKIMNEKSAALEEARSMAQVRDGGGTLVSINS